MTLCLPCACQSYSSLSSTAKTTGRSCWTLYLSCDRSKSGAAEQLSVHVNTVKYRIAQIQELTGLDLKDDETALQLMLSFKLMEYQEKFRPAGPAEL